MKIFEQFSRTVSSALRPAFARTASLALAAMLAVISPAIALDPPTDQSVSELLEQGRLSQARDMATTRLKASPGDPELTLQLAVTQVLQGVQRYSAEMYRLGLNPNGVAREIVFLRFPLPANPNPETATNDAVRNAVDRLRSDLIEAIILLEQIPDDWTGKVPMKFGRFKLDLDGNGDIAEDEELWSVVNRLNPRLSLDEKPAREFELHLDAGDVRWLEGYCHFLAAFADILHAYDTQQLFDHCAHLFFSRVESPYPYLIDSQDSPWYSSEKISDLIAFVHLINLPVSQPQRLQDALAHLEKTIPLSRRSWKCILAETDNDMEWLPKPGQDSAQGWTVSQEMLDSWFIFLNEAESVLAGRSLIPFWRGYQPDLGLNLRKVFTEPTSFDLVLWVQGPGATRYLENGRVVPGSIWELLRRAFDGNFTGFAVWFN